MLNYGKQSLSQLIIRFFNIRQNIVSIVVNLCNQEREYLVSAVDYFFGFHTKYCSRMMKNFSFTAEYFATKFRVRAIK